MVDYLQFTPFKVLLQFQGHSSFSNRKIFPSTPRAVIILNNFYNFPIPFSFFHEELYNVRILALAKKKKYEEKTLRRFTDSYRVVSNCILIQHR